METIITKRCGMCRNYFGLDSFNKDKSRGDGLATICRSCGRKRGKTYYKANSEIILKKQKKYRKENRDTYLKNLRAWQNNNRDKCRAYVKKWTENNLEHVKEQQRLWRENNKERTRIKTKKWADKNPDKRRFTAEKRRATKQKSGGVITRKEWQALLKKYNNTCLRCGRNDVKLTMDHVIPLSKGGRHEIKNIQPLCGSCNSKKHTKSIDYREN